MKTKFRYIAIFLLCCIQSVIIAQNRRDYINKSKEAGHYNINKFRQMDQELATPNRYRTASGAPGPAYYQQQADYKMDLRLDDKNAKLFGSQHVIYYNNAPETLDYLWVQLDQNVRAKDSKSPLVSDQGISKAMSARKFTQTYMSQPFDGGFKIDYVKDKNGVPLKYTINQTMMRIDLPTGLKTGQKFEFSIKWWYHINNYQKVGGRSGYEQFEDGNRLYVIAQFYPRMCVFSDVEGWQNMQFWGRGEFALTFGNYDVKITVPSDHVMEATGELQNREAVYSKEQLKRWKEAENNFETPVVIVTEEEAKKAEKGFATDFKTWHFKADFVRDFGFSTSRKFILDAMAVKLETTTPMAISLYPKEANPLWGEYSTKIVSHTLETYSKYTFDYPYPKAVSVSAEDQGMEYPMICWNYGRPDKNGKVSDRIKYGMMGVIIHEIGHNFFPMIVNSDERQWTWMDEGLNTFLEFLTERSWSDDFPLRRGPADKIVPYMSARQDILSPIMSNSENIFQFGANAYAKPATGLNILREIIMGPELFDYAFKTYANRWKFKHPTPEDFFRTMEDASGVDLDWFFRGWFYSTDFVDIAVDKVKEFYVSETPDEKMKGFQERMGRFGFERGPFLYMNQSNSDAKNKPFDYEDVKFLKKYIKKTYTQDQISSFKLPKYFYEVEFKLIGGMLMPIIVELTFEDGTTELHHFPAQIWRKNNTIATRVFATDKKVVKVQLDPKLQTADIDTSNNQWPESNASSVFDKFD